MIRLDWNIDRGLLFSTLALTAFGLVMVFNASIPISMERFNQPHYLFYRQLVWAAGGLLVFLIAIQSPIRLLARRWFIITMMAVTYAMLLAVYTQAPINNTRRWLHAAGLSFQPSELAKLAAVIFLAWYLSTHENLDKHPWRHLGRIGLVIGPMVALIIKEPDFGNAFMILLITVVLLFFGGFPIRHMLLMGAAAIPGMIGVILVSPYKLQRILVFLDPSSDPLGGGYQIRQSLIAIGHSGFWGTGLGQSTQKLFFLPEPHTDFIFALVAEELGFLGCAFIAAMFVYLFLRGVKISANAPSLFNRWLGSGLVSMLMIQTLINTSMVVNLGPTKGIPLPFVSMGGTSLVMSLLSMGILINISREVPEC